MRQRLAFPVLLVAFVGACTPLRTPITRSIGTSAYDLVIENGRIVDGTGAAWSYGDLAIRGDRIAAIGPRGAFRDARTSQRIDATGHVVAPGFIDIQAHSLWHYLRGNGLALSMVMQGITTAIHGEGSSYGPVNDRILAAESDTAMRRILAGFTGPRGFGDWLDHMVARGTAQNVGSFLGDGTLRRYVKGEDGGPLSAAERDTARAMVARAMRDGAFGIASALIYPPNTYASTEELIDAAEAMAPYGGIYITHMRSEGDKFLEAMDEALRIGREGGVPVEIYHLKASGPRNWPKMPLAIAKIDSARTAGQDVQANMYLYPAGGNSFASCIPPKYAEGGKLLENLKNRTLRGTMVAEMQARDAGYENLCEIAGPEGVMVVGFRTPELQRFEGKRLSEIAAALGTTWPEAIIDLNVAESLGLGEILFLMSEENMRLQLKQPYEVRDRCRRAGSGHGARLDPSTRLWKLPANLPEVCPGGRGAPLGGRGAQSVICGRDASLPHRSRGPQGRAQGRCDRLRSRDNHRPCDLRAAASAFDRDAGCVRERGRRGARRASHRGQARSGRARTGLPALIAGGADLGAPSPDRPTPTRSRTPARRGSRARRSPRSRPSRKAGARRAARCD